MANGLEDNGTPVFCKGSLVTHFKAGNNVTGNGKFRGKVVTTRHPTQMT